MMVRFHFTLLAALWAASLPALAAEGVSPKPASFLDLVLPHAAGRWNKTEVASARASCAKQLEGLDLEFEAIPPIGQPGGCGTPAPVLLKSVAGVAIEPPAEVTCAFAEALHGWVAWAVKPAATAHLKKQLTVIRNASAYACRRRNNSATGKLSEHAIANALDIATLGFDDGSSVTIKGDWSGLSQLVGLSARGAFLRRIRQYACIRFTTVLGPGTDRYHGDHFHVDLARRRSGYRICN